jgi:hypothetical protein
VQQILLEVIKSTTATFILPAGVVLRAFPPTRNAGSFLIATAMGFHIIYSYTYVMHKLIVEKMIENSNLPSALANMFNDSSLAEGLSPFALAEKGFFDMKVLFFHPLEALGFLLLQALFLPALSITLTVSFIKWMAKFLSQKM